MWLLGVAALGFRPRLASAPRLATLRGCDLRAMATLRRWSPSVCRKPSARCHLVTVCSLTTNHNATAHFVVGSASQSAIDVAGPYQADFFRPTAGEALQPQSATMGN